VAVLLSGRAVPEGVPDLPSNTPSGFSASHRLLRKDGFVHVLRAEAVLDEFFKVFFVQNEKSYARLGVVASKKVLPCAVRRNCIKRTVREIFRHHSIKVSKLDLVVMVRSVHAHRGSEQKQSLNMLLNRIQNRCAKQ
jgi:ribonuclease P protein component